MTTRSVSIPDTEVHALHSGSVGDDFELWIGRPQAGFTSIPVGPLRVLYLLDANLFFGTAVEMTRLMHKLHGELAPLLVVGVAYATSDFMLQGALRTRDFTPSHDAGVAAMAASFPTSSDIRRIEPRMGGADAFLGFLEHEVRPLIEQRFDVQPGGATLFGSSLGGLFVTHTFLTAPTTFDHYIAVSPALWWNEGEALDAVSTRLRLRGDQAVTVAVAVGGLEESPRIPALAPFKMVTNARELVTRLQSDAEPTLRVDLHELDGETHTSVVPVALSRSLRAIHRGPAPAGPS